jgi:hypothetical protein
MGQGWAVVCRRLFLSELPFFPVFLEISAEFT